MKQSNKSPPTPNLIKLLTVQNGIIKPQQWDTKNQIKYLQQQTLKPNFFKNLNRSIKQISEINGFSCSNFMSYCLESIHFFLKSNLKKTINSKKVFNFRA